MVESALGVPYSAGHSRILISWLPLLLVLLVLFVSLIIHTFHFFLVGTVFFSHSKSVETVFCLVLSCEIRYIVTFQTCPRLLKDFTIFSNGAIHVLYR